MRMIPEWRSSWRMFSVRAMTLAAAIQSTWLSIPEDLKANLPAPLVHWLTLGLLVFGLVGRLIQQPEVSDAKDKP